LYFVENEVTQYALHSDALYMHALAGNSIKTAAEHWLLTQKWSMLNCSNIITAMASSLFTVVHASTGTNCNITHSLLVHISCVKIVTPTLFSNNYNLCSALRGKDKLYVHKQR